MPNTTQAHKVKVKKEIRRLENMLAYYKLDKADANYINNRIIELRNEIGVIV